MHRKIILLVSLIAAAGTSPAHANPLRLGYLGQQIVPTGESFDNTVVGGLSGIDRDPATGRYYALSDDRSQLNAARYYSLDLDLSKFNRAVNPGREGVRFSGVTTLRNTDGTPFASGAVDPESVRFRDGTLFWTSEGERNASTQVVQNPFVRASHLDGSHAREFAVPAYYNPVDAFSSNPGIRQNLAFESLTLSNDGRVLYTATENSLGQDSPFPTTVLAGSPSRILSFNAATGVAGAEYVYVTDPVVALPNPISAFATNGLVELLNLPGHDNVLIAVERSFSIGIGYSIRLYLADLGAATDVSGLPDLGAAASPIVPVSKQLLLDLGTLTNDDGSAVVLDNIEGITWTQTADGGLGLVLVSDNNFSAGQFTQFLAFEVTRVSEPATLLLLGPVVVGLRRLRSAHAH